MPGDTDPPRVSSRKRKGVEQYAPSTQRQQGFRHGTSPPSDSPSPRGGRGRGGAGAARRSRPAGARGGGGRSTRSRTSIISSPTSPGSPGVALRARAPGGQVATPERWQALIRFKLWQQAKEHSVEHHESAQDIADEFGIHPTLLWQWSAKASRPGGLSTADRTASPTSPTGCTPT